MIIVFCLLVGFSLCGVWLFLCLLLLCVAFFVVVSYCHLRFVVCVLRLIVFFGGLLTGWLNDDFLFLTVGFLMCCDCCCFVLWLLCLLYTSLDFLSGVLIIGF